MKVAVSIIIPSLNSIDYYKECIESALAQTMKEIEIICVDAGSTDGTRELIAKKMEDDARIKLIDSDMRSYGHQMNLGLAAASGEYISILESDDLLMPHAVKYYYDIAAGKSLDFVKSDTGVFKGDGEDRKVNPRKLHTSEAFYDRIWNPSENPTLLRLYNLTQPGLYRLDFLRENDVRYNESPGASYQDNGFTLQVFTQAKRAMFTHEVCYLLRRDNPGSSVMSTGKVFAMCDEYDYIRQRLLDRGLNSFLPMCAACRYPNYEFTCSRIGDWNRPAFFERYANDFRRLDELGELDRSLFTAAEWSRIHEIMRLGSDYYYLGWRDRQQLATANRRAKAANKKAQANAGGLNRILKMPVKLAKKAKSMVASGNESSAAPKKAIAKPFDKDYGAFLDGLCEDELALQISRAFSKSVGWPPNLENPVSYNDKVQYRKLHDERRGEKSKLVNKLGAREWVQQQGLERLLPQLYGTWKSFDDVKLNELPESFVLRCTHARDFDMFVPHKAELAADYARMQFNEWQSGDFSSLEPLEMEYQGIERSIIAEEMLYDQSSDEYVIWCFGGAVHYIQVNTIDEGNKRHMSFFDRDWNWQTFKYAFGYDEKMPKKPGCLDEMLSAAETLAGDFDHIRVHFRLVENRVVFEQFTFSANSGFCNWSIPETDAMLGALWQI